MKKQKNKIKIISVWKNKKKVGIKFCASTELLKFMDKVYSILQRKGINNE